MRGRNPFPVDVSPEDLPVLEEMARRQTAPAFHVRRARTLLAARCGERLQTIAARLNCNRKTVRRTCDRYQQ